MRNIFKIVVLGVIGFGLLVFITAPKHTKPKDEVKKDIVLNTSLFPSHFEVIGTSGYVKKSDLFKKGLEKYIIILNHDALSLVETLKLNTRKDIVLVANISNTPWFIKKLAVNGKLEELNQGSNIPLINDTNGNLIKALNLFDDTQTKYFIYKVNSDSSIIKINESSVKEGALENGLTKNELEKEISRLLSQLN